MPQVFICPLLERYGRVRKNRRREDHDKKELLKNESIMQGNL